MPQSSLWREKEGPTCPLSTHADGCRANEALKSAMGEAAVAARVCVAVIDFAVEPEQRRRVASEVAVVPRTVCVPVGGPVQANPLTLAPRRLRGVCEQSAATDIYAAHQSVVVQCLPVSTSSKKVPLVCRCIKSSRRTSQHASSPGFRCCRGWIAHILWKSDVREVSSRSHVAGESCLLSLRPVVAAISGQPGHGRRPRRRFVPPCRSRDGRAIVGRNDGRAAPVCSRAIIPQRDTVRYLLSLSTPSLSHSRAEKRTLSAGCSLTAPWRRCGPLSLSSSWWRPLAAPVYLLLGGAVFSASVAAAAAA